MSVKSTLFDSYDVKIIPITKGRKFIGSLKPIKGVILLANWRISTMSLCLLCNGVTSSVSCENVFMKFSNWSRKCNFCSSSFQPETEGVNQFNPEHKMKHFLSTISSTIVVPRWIDTPTKCFTVNSPPANPIHCIIRLEDDKEVVAGGAQIWREHRTTEPAQQRRRRILSIINSHIVTVTGRRCLQIEGVKPTKSKKGEHRRLKLNITKNLVKNFKKS